MSKEEVKSILDHETQRVPCSKQEEILLEIYMILNYLFKKIES